jgi:DNA-binding transcriptional ArsR family regulator
MQENLRLFKAEFFRAMAHPTRIAIVELLRDEGEVNVARIHDQLKLEQANVSQHLAVLRSKQIVISRKKGNQVFYVLRDPLIGEVFDLMRDYFHAHQCESLQLPDCLESGEKSNKNRPALQTNLINDDLPNDL